MSAGGRLRRLAGIVPGYAQVAWLGLVTPRLERPLTVHQAVVLREGRVLLAVRRELRGWELPGGYAEAGESGERAVVREVMEETGVRVAVERLVGEYERTGFRPHTARVYACRYEGGTPRASDEMPRVAWFDCGRLPETLFPWFRTPLEDALRGGGPVRRHEHQGLRSILAGLRIDLRMRATDDRGGRGPRGGAPGRGEGGG